jgi:hypothetical protein
MKCIMALAMDKMLMLNLLQGVVSSENALIKR